MFCRMNFVSGSSQPHSISFLWCRTLCFDFGSSATDKPATRPSSAVMRMTDRRRIICVSPYRKRRYQGARLSRHLQVFQELFERLEYGIIKGPMATVSRLAWEELHVLAC